MFAKVVSQNEEIKKVFYEKIKETVEKRRANMNEKIDEELSDWISWLAKPVANVAFSYYRGKEKLQGEEGEESIQRALWLWLPKDNILMNEIVLEVRPDEFIQIDHLVLSPKGLFVIETKAWDGAYLGSKNKWRMKQSGNWVECKSPTKQNERHVRLFKEWLSENFKQYDLVKDFIFPIVAFKRAKWVKADNCGMPVVNGGLEVIGYMKSIKGENIASDIYEEISDYISVARPINKDEWEMKHAKAPKPQKAIEFTEGKTKAGKTFVRVKGNLDEATKIAEDYREGVLSLTR